MFPFPLTVDAVEDHPEILVDAKAGAHSTQLGAGGLKLA